MATVIGIAGSLRTNSFNAALLRAAIDVAPPGIGVQVASIAGIPLYDGDFEREHGIPEVVEVLKEKIASAQGLLLVTPEYNSGIPGVFKNAIDWLSRPARDIGRVFGDKKVALIGATPGRAGTRDAQMAWLAVLRSLGTRPWFGKSLHVAGASTVFDAEGKLVDAKVRELLTDYMRGFGETVLRR